jgi:hypothetical protein
MDSLPADFYDTGSVMRRARFPIVLAVGVSLAAHLIMALLWRDPPETRAPSASTIELELTLVPPAETPIPPVEPGLDPADPVRDESVAPEPLAQSPQAPPVPDPVAETESVAQTEDPTPVRQPLKLQSPENWDQVLQQPAPSNSVIAELPFHPELREEAGKVRSAAARRQLFAIRERAITGLSEDEFGGLQGLDSETVKIDDRCYTLRPSASVGNGTEWWMTGCMDSRQHPATLQPLEYDGTGRVVAD